MEATDAARSKVPEGGPEREGAEPGDQGDISKRPRPARRYEISEWVPPQNVAAGTEPRWTRPWSVQGSMPPAFTALAGEAEELIARTPVVTKDSQQGGGDGARPGRLDTAQGHAGVIGLEDHADALGVQVIL
jgi:hypothetical protein